MESLQEQEGKPQQNKEPKKEHKGVLGVVYSLNPMRAMLLWWMQLT